MQTSSLVPGDGRGELDGAGAHVLVSYRDVVEIHRGQADESDMAKAKSTMATSMLLLARVRLTRRLVVVMMVVLVV